MTKETQLFTPTITIILFANDANNIEDCIFNLQRQTYKKLQIIIFVNRHYQLIWEKVQWYAKNDNRTEVYQTDAEKSGKIFNLSFNKIIGDYIIYLTSRHTLKINIIKKLVNKLRKQPCDLIIFKALVKLNDFGIAMPLMSCNKSWFEQINGFFKTKIPLQSQFLIAKKYLEEIKNKFKKVHFLYPNDFLVQTFLQTKKIKFLNTFGVYFNYFGDYKFRFNQKNFIKNISEVLTLELDLITNLIDLKTKKIKNLQNNLYTKMLLQILVICKKYKLNINDVVVEIKQIEQTYQLKLITFNALWKIIFRIKLHKYLKLLDSVILNTNWKKPS